jgi:ribose transport system ATP-binding protein
MKPSSDNDLILKIQSITKTFPGVKALTDVNFDLKRGEIHAIVGENGAGKSTLIKILSGAYQPDGGELFVEGQNIGRLNPRKANELGIHTIYQENTLVPYMTVAENVFLGEELTNKLHIMRWKRTYRETEKILKELNINIDSASMAGTLGIAEQQAVQIAKALVHEGKIIIMDEPTSSFGKREIDNLFNIIRTIKAQGKSVIYISHHLDEVFEIADRITVLRDGRYIATFNKDEVNRSLLINNMVGRDISAFYQKETVPIGVESFRVENMCRGNSVKSVSFSANKGEILGIYGLVGAGRTELARLIFGVDKRDSGKVFMYGKEITPKNPKDAIKQGLCFITEDRRKSGLVVHHSIKSNITLPGLNKFKGLFLNLFKEDKIAEKYMQDLRIKAPNVYHIVSNLSGGNQQKVVIAKWLFSSSEVYLFDEPTRGIDVGAKEEIYKICVSLVKEGKTVILITSDMEELLSMSDRILIMREGMITAELNKSEALQNRVLSESIGGEKIG